MSARDNLTGNRKINLTVGRIESFECPPDKRQAFLWDADPKSGGLGVRVTPNGRPSFVFQGTHGGKRLRITIGRVDSWSIPDARKEARRIQQLIDSGRDPRIVSSEQAQSDREAREVKKRNTVTVREAWDKYLKARKPDWSEKHYRDQVFMAQKGGEPRPRWKGKKTIAGPLASLMDHKLSEITSERMESWAKVEIKKRPSRTRLALRHFKAFLTWASETKPYKQAVNPDAATGKKLANIVGKDGARSDSLQREQLPAWFEEVQKIHNPVISAYLQCLLLTGARYNELASLKWVDVDFQWNSLAISDKVEGDRVIPLTPYVSYLMQSLPKRNKWVFSSPTSASGHLVSPEQAHRRANKAAGLHVTLHGLRRSFKSLSEWKEVPTGVVAQIMGHKPSATAEKHYTVRPLDLLRMHHTAIEQWVLEQAGIEFNPEVKPGLKVVSND